MKSTPSTAVPIKQQTESVAQAATSLPGIGNKRNLTSAEKEEAKRLRDEEIPQAELAIGLRAIELPIPDERVKKLVEKFRQIGAKIEKAKEELNSEDIASFSGRVKRAAAEANLKALTKQKDSVLVSVGQIVRESPSLDEAGKLLDELSKANSLVKRLAVYGLKPKSEPGPVAKAVAVLLVVGFAIFMAMNVKPEGNPSMARAKAQLAVKAQMNFPDEADFPWNPDITVQAKSDPTVWLVIGKVSGKNAFGVKKMLWWGAVVQGPTAYADSSDIHAWKCYRVIVDTMSYDIDDVPPDQPDLKAEIALLSFALLHAKTQLGSK